MSVTRGFREGMDWRQVRVRVRVEPKGRKPRRRPVARQPSGTTIPGGPRDRALPVSGSVGAKRGSMASPGNHTVRVEARALKAVPRDRIHLLPVTIESDGNAKVDQYFTPAVQERDGELLVSYRGRALRGQDLPVPPGYVGLVLREDQKPCSDEEERAVSMKSAFSSLTYWNLETRPTPDDTVVMAMGWTQIAQAMHAPVGEE